MFYRCPKCTELFAADTVPLAKCTACGLLLRVSPAEPARDETAPPAPPPMPIAIAWEVAPDPRTTPQRYWRTLLQLTKSAPQVFASFEEAPPRHAERFAYLSSLIGFLGYFAVQLWIYRDDGGELARLVDLIARASNRPPRPDGVQKVFAWGLALSPLLAALPAHVLAGLYQLGLWFFRANTRSYDVTFRVVSYGLAPMILLAIPGIGPLLAPGWIFALHWSGIASAHRLPLLVAFLVIAMPALSIGLLLVRGFGQLLLLLLTQ
ncbi:MAG: YIP1 family protein [Deltaproteobacteria bacterium]|nr:YIP1 family protein [Deltaproteobacteria bacterium]